jgi:GxxExxY protein
MNGMDWISGGKQMLHQEITEQIIGAAYEVYNQLGFGFLECVYERSLAVELRLQGFKCDFQYPIAVRYKEQLVGEYVADLIVEGRVIVELKSVRALSQSHEIQLVNYLSATGIDVGLLINFGESKVEVRRKLRSLPTATTSNPIQ